MIFNMAEGRALAAVSSSRARPQTGALFHFDPQHLGPAHFLLANEKFR